MSAMPTPLKEGSQTDRTRKAAIKEYRASLLDWLAEQVAANSSSDEDHYVAGKLAAYNAVVARLGGERRAG